MNSSKPPFSSIRLTRRLCDGFDRIAMVLRANQWSSANASGLNPAQTQVLNFLIGRGEAGVRVKEIASHLGVSQPTATETILALERKDMISKAPDPQDGRAIAVKATAGGKKAVKAIGTSATQTENAISQMSIDEQTDLLLLQVKLIRLLQQSGAIPEQRMCVTCQYFQPNINSDAENPHHCAFVNAAFGNRNLRLDCGEHETAEPSAQATTWQTFTKQGSDHLQATL